MATQSATDQQQARYVNDNVQLDRLAGFWRCRICCWTEGTGRGIILAWRKNQLMKRGVRRERHHLSTGVRQNSNHQNVEMQGSVLGIK
jgi:hypothetical protein